MDDAAPHVSAAPRAIPLSPIANYRHEMISAFALDRPQCAMSSCHRTPLGSLHFRRTGSLRRNSGILKNSEGKSWVSVESRG